MDYPNELPGHLKTEYERYVKDPKKYKKLYPVSWRILAQYLDE